MRWVVRGCCCQQQSLLSLLLFGGRGRLSPVVGAGWVFYYGFSAIPGRNSVTVGIDVDLGIEKSKSNSSSKHHSKNTINRLLNACNSARCTLHSFPRPI